MLWVQEHSMSSKAMTITLKPLKQPAVQIQPVHARIMEVRI